MNTHTDKPNIIQRVLEAINTFQLSNPITAVIYAVIKKYGDDNASYYGAIITYYGFLSLFPLLIVATTVTNFIAQYNSAIRGQVVTVINTYFPIVGSQVQTSIHSSGRLGLALFVTLIITFYGARGVADATQYVLNQLWQAPRTRLPSFLKALLTSFLMIIIGGLGVLIAAILSSVATAAGHSLFLTSLSTIISSVILFGVFAFIMTIGSAARHSFRDNIPGAVVAAVGLQVLQTLGGYLITHQLHNLQGAYGHFALVLAILFWLYLQAEVFLYAVELNTVLALQLWPRSLLSTSLTAADKKIQRMYVDSDRSYGAKRERITTNT
jgi:membrane protein